MTRKRKIQFAVASIALGVIAIAFWPGEDSDEGKVAFVGVSSIGSNTVSFAITNTFKADFEYFAEIQVLTNGYWAARPVSFWEPDGDVLESVTNPIDTMRFATNRWKISIGYAHSFTPSFIQRTKNKLARLAWAQNWNELGERLYYAPGYGTVQSPIMLGNKPVAAEEK